jgi:hypothetical protein
MNMNSPVIGTPVRKGIEHSFYGGDISLSNAAGNTAHHSLLCCLNSQKPFHDPPPQAGRLDTRISQTRSIPSLARRCQEFPADGRVLGFRAFGGVLEYDGYGKEMLGTR